MKTLMGIVTDRKQLELAEDVALPAGTRVRIRIEPMEGDDDYGARVAEYYESSTKEMLDQERAIAEELSVADSSLADEEPWW